MKGFSIRPTAAFTKAKALPTNVGHLPGLFGWLESSISVWLPQFGYLESNWNHF
jgi:hypothetical protein